MRTAALFIPDDATVDALVAAYPLAQLASVAADGLIATPFPLPLERSADGRVHLLGHLFRQAPDHGVCSE